jgi:hypothetical protein
MNDPQKKKFAQILMATTVLVAIAAMAGSARAQPAAATKPACALDRYALVTERSATASLGVDF